MSDAVARGSLVLSLDAQQLSKGLSKAAKDTKAKGSEIAKGFKDSTREKLGETFGGGSLAGMGAKAGIAGLAVAGIAMLGKELYDLATNAHEFHKELERGQRVTEKWAEGISTGIERAKERLSEFDDIAGTAEGMQALNRELSLAESKLKETSAALESGEKEVDKWSSKWNSTDAMSKYLSSELEDTKNAEKAKLETVRKANDAQLKAVEEFRRKKQEIENRNSVEAKKALRQFIKEQADAVKDIEGRTADERKLDDLKDKFGFNAGDLAAARLAVQAKNAAQNVKDADDVIKSLTADIGELQGIAKKTSEEEKLDDLIKKGADQGQIDRIKTLIDLKKKAAQQFTPLQALEKGTAAEISFQQKSKFEGERDKAVKQQLDELKQQNKILGDIRDGVKKLDKDTPEI